MSIAEQVQLDLTGEHAGNVAAATVPHRHPDHDTSVAAAHHSQRSAKALRWDVLALLAEHPEGLTDVQIETALGVKRPTGGNRRGDLVKLGQVEPSGDRRVVPGHLAAKVWRITEAGWSALKVWRITEAGWSALRERRS